MAQETRLGSNLLSIKKGQEESKERNPEKLESVYGNYHKVTSIYFDFHANFNYREPT